MTTIIGNTTNYHNPLSQLDSGSLLSLNQRFGNLDAAIDNLAGVAAGVISVTAGEGIAVNDAIYINRDDLKAYLLDNDSASANVGLIRGFATSTASTDAPIDIQIGDLLDGFTGLTALQPVYADSTAGSITQTRPVPTKGGAQVAIIQLGIAWSATQILIRPLDVQYHLRHEMAENDELTIVHHYDDVSAPLRKIWAYITEMGAGAEATGYANANQDSDVNLRYNGPLTYTADQCTGGTASASDDSGGVRPASNAFDNGGTGLGSLWNDSAGGGTGHLQYDFGSGVTKTIQQYTLYIDPTYATRAPTAWTFRGSNDDSSWTTLDTQSGETTWSSTNTYNFSNSTAYRYYRLNITANNGDGTNLALSEIEMMEAATTATSKDKLAQTFAVGSSTNVASVGLWLKKVGAPTGTAAVRIETLSGSEPSGTLADPAATITFAESGLGTSYAEKLLTFASEFTLASGSYALVLRSDRSADASNYIAWGADESSPAYAGGEMFGEISASWSAESKDAIFSIYEPGVVNVGRISVDWWSSSHTDIANRYGDGAGSDGDTKTTFKCIRPSGFDDVTLVVELA